MAPRSHSFLTVLFYLLYFLFSSLHDNTLFANAQSYTPRSTSGSISAFIDGKAMYVQGGTTAVSSTTAQSFVLDLSTSWDLAVPAYKQLPDGINSRLNPGALLNDSTTLFIMNDTNFHYYNVQDGQKTTYSTTFEKGRSIMGSGCQAATNPRTGHVYIPGGYYGKDGLELLRFDPTTNEFITFTMPVELQSIMSYPVAWVPHLDAMLIFGGYYYKTFQSSSSLYQYNYGNGTWTLLRTSGDGPSPRSDACLTPVNNGRSIIVFGGETSDNVTLHDIYVLDVETWKWRRGHDAPLADARVKSSCAVSNDMFVAFGGHVRDLTDHSNERLLAVYSLKTDSWVDRFTYTPLPTGGGSGSGGSGSSGSGSGSGSGPNLGGIIGGIAGGCVVLCGIFYAIHRRRKSKETEPGQDVSQEGGTFSNNPQPPAHTTIIKQAQLEEELVLARQIEEQMARLQTLKDQLQASEVGSPVPSERSSQGPQIVVSYPAPPPLKDEDGSYIPPPSTATMPGEGRNPQIVYARMNSQYTQPVEGDEYVDEHTGPRNPQLR